MIEEDQETDVKIKQLLANYPTVNRAKKIKSIHSFIYLVLGVLSIIFSQYTILGFDVGPKILGLIGLCVFGYKALSVPLDIDNELNSNESESLLTVATYNPSVKAYIEAQAHLTKRDYYYLNIAKQLAIIAQVKGQNTLK